MIKHYINLTNGIEAIKEYSLKEYSFIRIQSTALEQKRWSFILEDLDNDFLMNLAIGNDCVIYDFGANKETSRAIWQGVPFIEYILNKYWYNDTSQVFCKGHNCTNYFNEIYHRELQDRTFKKLRYFKKFLSKDITCVNISTISNRTEHDSNIEFYKEVINKYGG